MHEFAIQNQILEQNTRYITYVVGFDFILVRREAYNSLSFFTTDLGRLVIFS